MTDELTDKKLKQNMRIWNEVWKVDSDYTKPIEDGRGLTSIVAMYLFRQATQQWGPMGEGWGFEIEKDDFINNKDNKPEFVLHVMTIKLWYRIGTWAQPIIDGKVVEGLSDPNIRFTYGVGCTKLFAGTPNSTHGLHVNEDFNKSTLTDAITNALSRLGFGASVRLGEHPGKYNDLMSDEDAALARAWEKYIPWSRKAKGLGSDITDALIINTAISYLQKNSRLVNPATIAALMEE